VEGSADWQRLQRVVTGDTPADAEVIDLIEEIRASGAVEQSFAVAESFIDSAKRRVQHLPDLETVDLLTSVADFALSRAS
jgi:geranylgeranyl pyrophosphate synthase